VIGGDGMEGDAAADTRCPPPNIPPTSRFKWVLLIALVFILNHWCPFISTGVRWWLVYIGGMQSNARNCRKRDLSLAFPFTCEVCYGEFSSSSLLFLLVSITPIAS